MYPYVRPCSSGLVCLYAYRQWFQMMFINASFKPHVYMWENEVKLSLYLINQHTMNKRAGVEVKLNKIRTSALDGGKRSGPRHDRFHPTEMTPAVHSTGR